jgi:hypothetical protein
MTILGAGVVIGAAVLLFGCDRGRNDVHIGTWEMRESVLGRHMLVTLNEDNTGTMLTKINFRDSGTARTIRWARLGDMVLLFHLVDGNRTGVPFKYLKVQDGELCWIDPKNPDFEPVAMKPGKPMTSMAHVRPN